MVPIELQKPRRRDVEDPLDLPVLVLNRHFTPVTLTSARRAFVLLYGGAAEALDEAGNLHDFATWSTQPVREGDDGVATLRGALRVPRVLHLLRYDRAPRLAVRLSRRNVMLRDQHQCQYCGRSLAVRELNVDHMQPRSRGGADTWENLVTSCRSCNLKKGHRTPEEAGMRLLSVPRRPRWSAAAHLMHAQLTPFAEWQPYLAAG